MEEKSIVRIQIEKGALQNFIQAVRGVIDNNREYQDTIKVLVGIQEDNIPFYEAMAEINEESKNTLGLLSRIVGDLSPVEEYKKIIEIAQSNITDLKNFENRLSTVKEGTIRLHNSFNRLETSVDNMEKKLKPLLDFLQKFEDISNQSN